jgi:hypothetical protein
MGGGSNEDRIETKVEQIKRLQIGSRAQGVVDPLLSLLAGEETSLSWWIWGQ